MKRIRAVVTLLLCAAVYSGWCHAETPLLKKDGNYGADFRLYRSAVDTKGHFTVDGTGILPHNKFSLGLSLDFGFRGWMAPEIKNPDVYRKTRINTFIFSILQFNWGFKDMISVGFGVPIAVPSGTGFNGYTPDGHPDSRAWSTSGGFGDLSIHAKLRWIRADRHPLGLGTVFQYQIPTGDQRLLMGSPRGGAFRARLIVDAEPRSWYRVAFNLTMDLPFGALVGVNNRISNHFALADHEAGPVLFKYGPNMTAGLGNSFSIWPTVMDFVVEAYAMQILSEFTNNDYLSIEANAGFKLYIEESSYLMAGYAAGIPASGERADNPGYGMMSMAHRMFLGFAYEPSIGDRDRDGIKDDVDQCPTNPEDKDDYLDSDGCPEPDNDLDGIPDYRDKCPLVPEDLDGSEDRDGCPERDAEDRDGDGIPDNRDRCPDNPEDLDGFEDADGCPDPDNDQDGILDVNDNCPDDPEDMDGYQDTDGCPDPDNDGDRILDINDRCPDNAEVYNGKDDDDGCPDQGDVILQGDSIQILKKVYFEYDSANIKNVSYDILDAVAQTIINNPQINLVEVAGHADENGSADYNLKLTTDRAASVMRYLLGKGVPEKALTSMGYGEYCPIEEGRGEAVWEKNRRVEFKVLVSDGRPTGARRGCDLAEQAGVTPATTETQPATSPEGESPASP